MEQMAKFEVEIQKRIERNRMFIQKLQQCENPPLYAFSALEAAKHDKGKVWEAHISLLKDADRAKMLDAADYNGRTCAMFAAYYSNLESIELLAASDATFSAFDKFGRTCLHYASMQDNSKVINIIFMECKTRPQIATAAQPSKTSDNVDQNC